MTEDGRAGRARTGTLRLVAVALGTIAVAAPPAAAAQGVEVDPLTAMARAARAAGPVLPVDDATRDPELFAFRARLQRALVERDTAAVLAAADPDIKLSFGGQYGRAALRENLSDEAYWGELASALALGGVLVSDSSFYAPYPFERFPPTVDPFEGFVVVGESVRVRAAPDTSAPVLDSRSWEVVVRDREAERSAGLPWDGPWTAVRLPEGRTGYVASRFLRSPIDYRAGFAYRGGRWWIVVFIAGD